MNHQLPSSSTSPSGRMFITSQFSSYGYWRALSEKSSFKIQSIALRNITNHTLYKTIFAIIILLAALFEILVLQESKNREGNNNHQEKQFYWVEWLQYFFQFYFMLDIFLRIRAHYPDYKAFFEDTWNKFDVLLVTLTLLPIIATKTSARNALGLYY